MATTMAQLVPVLAHYKIKHVPGTRENGVYATQMIAGGARIICEAPLISLPAPGDQVDGLMSAFDALSGEDQDKFLNLNPSRPSASAILAKMERKLMPKLMALTEEAHTEEEKRILDGRFTELERSVQCYHIAGCWHSSLYPLTSHIPKSSPLPEGTHVSGLFIATAQLRHSCVPNCLATINSNKGVMTVHTMRPITQGEELTVQAIDIYYDTANTRAANLHTQFGTTCTCEACVPSHPKFKKHEACRLANYTHAREIANLFHPVSVSVPVIDHASVRVDLCLSDSNLARPGHAISIEDLRKKELIALALIKSLKDTGCVSPELVRWHEALIDRVQPRIAHVLADDEERVRYWRIMLFRAIECEKIVGKCYGADSAEFQWAALRRANMEGVIERAKKHTEWLKESKKKVLG